jgi:hypothetical protein
MTDDLKAAVEELYRVFAPYRRTPMDDYCTHCVNEQEYARLVEPELRDVGHEAIDHYMFNAIFTWGDVNGFKRFLPRIYEALAFERHKGVWASGKWAPIARLADANWQEWPKIECQVIERYLDLIWLDVLDGELAHPDDDVVHDAHAIFDGLATIFEDVQPFLDAWQERIAESLGAAERFAQFVRFNVDVFHKGKALGYEGWTKEAEAQVQEWLRGPSLLRKLDDWLVECKDDAILWCLSEAIELLADYQRKEQ